MWQATTLSLLALVTTVGGIAGTKLGKDTIAEMNPVFFSERPEPATFYADYQAAPAPLPTGPGWDYPYDWARPPVCWGCPGQPDPYLDPYVRPFADPSDTPIPTSGKAAVRMVRDEPFAPAAGQRSLQRSVERYLSFPVNEDDARRRIVKLQQGRSDSAPGGDAERSVGM